MIHWEIDNVEDILAIIAIIMVLVYGIITIITRKNVKASLGKYGITATDGKGECPMDIQTQHQALLDDLRRGQDKMLELLEKVVKRVNAIDESQGALISQAAIMQKFVRRELGRMNDDSEINGDLDEADEEINRAKQSYRVGREL